MVLFFLQYLLFVAVYRYTKVGLYYSADRFDQSQQFKPVFDGRLELGRAILSLGVYVYFIIFFYILNLYRLCNALNKKNCTVFKVIGI